MYLDCVICNWRVTKYVFWVNEVPSFRSGIVCQTFASWASVTDVRQMTRQDIRLKRVDIRNAIMQQRYAGGLFSDMIGT